ncbi:hypothetical protein FKP32DRAFT_1674719 [Trametes sanguinea]|nr:hypothetical protein FKP32DRAFT_1674719 [Trametes sanguinea]
MEGLQFVRFPDLAAIVKAVQPYDDGSMNGVVGTLYDHLKRPAPASWDSYFLCGVYHGSDLLLTLTMAPMDRAWGLGCPRSVLGEITPATLKAATDVLAKSVLDLTHPLAITLVNGEADAVNAFLTSWVEAAASKGTRLRMKDPAFDARASYATRETVPPPPPTKPDYEIVLATGEDFDQLFPIYLDFTKQAGPGTRALDVEEAHLRFVIAQGTTWLCRIDNALVGFIVLGRVTPNTIAIRHVYVIPEHRRKGIAEGLVRAINRYYLGMRPVGYDGIPDGDPAVGVKSFVCINTSSAENIYRRAGFLFPVRTADEQGAGGRDPISGKKAWYRHILRGVEPEKAP